MNYWIALPLKAILKDLLKLVKFSASMRYLSEIIGIKIPKIKKRKKNIHICRLTMIVALVLESIFQFVKFYFAFTTNLL